MTTDRSVGHKFWPKSDDPYLTHYPSPIVSLVYQVRQKIARSIFLQLSQDWLRISRRNFTHLFSHHIRIYRY